MTVKELITELLKLKAAGYGGEEVVYLGGEYRHDYQSISHLHVGRYDRGRTDSVVINGSEDD